MATKKTKSATAASAESKEANPLKNLKRNTKFIAANSEVHILKKGIKCDTEAKGHATRNSRSPLELLVDATDGFIPLWSKNTTLRWRFRERSLNYFDDVAVAKKEIRKLFGEALLAWGTACPVKFKEDDDLWDFEIVMKSNDDCDDNGCTLASAFFPDAGRHKLYIYPMMFEYSRKEQRETLIHEIGHVFGLRHYFALVEEKEWPAELFGSHRKFSIMNYGNLSHLSATDKKDLTRLYKSVWSGDLTEINGTRIKQVKPYSSKS